MSQGRGERYLADDPRPTPPSWPPPFDQAAIRPPPLACWVCGEAPALQSFGFRLVLERLSFPRDPAVWLGGPGLSHQATCCKTTGRATKSFKNNNGWEVSLSRVDCWLRQHLQVCWKYASFRPYFSFYALFWNGFFFPKNLSSTESQ